MTGARSEETGQDYEHLELLLTKFQEFKLRVQAGEEKYKVDFFQGKLETVILIFQRSVKALPRDWRMLIAAMK